MTKTVRNALDLMKHFSPYNQETGDLDTYNEIYETMHKLANLNIITSDEWKSIYTLDEKLYNAN